ncbi:MAG: D-tyrosyl-tRNA(Tyr) deacylase [Bacteroidales bacterium]|nr:D-tyrosyl-tRNA(Tyr) deacylase [Bacteroidales bacterium]
MRAVVQRVKYARITINHSEKKHIRDGSLILLGIEESDNLNDIEWLAGKIARLRIFNDDEKRMNLSLLDIRGEAMVVSQFTLHASTKKGNRPSWIRSAKPEVAEPIYVEFVKVLGSHLENKIVTGDFGAHMEIELVNDGPVTIYLDTKQKE